MARPLRIEYPGAWYHVMNRGSGKQKVFYNSKSYELFLELLSDIHDRYQIQIHAYCLMGNHYHLLVHSPFPNLGRAMRHIDSLYTVRNNRLIKRDGPLFRGRYKAILVEAEQYLLQLSRYIHLNPVVAKIVSSPEDYPWSSYKYFISEEKPNWLYREETLNRFSSNPCESYKKFVLTETEEKLNFDTKIPPILGSEFYIKKIKEEKITALYNKEIPAHSKLLKQFTPSMKDVINTVAQHFNISSADVLNKSGTLKKLPKKIAIYLCCLIGQQRQKTVAKYFGELSYSAVSKICQRLEIDMRENRKILHDLNTIKRNLSNVQT